MSRSAAGSGAAAAEAETVALIQSLLATEHASLVIKPLTSKSQGAHVRRVRRGMGPEEILSLMRSIPTATFVIQEYVPYTAIYRVIVVNNTALDLSYTDRSVGAHE